MLRGWPSTPPEAVELMGHSFASSDDYWRLYETLSRRLDEHHVAVVRDLQSVHPRAAAAIAHLCDDTCPPFPQSVLLLLLSPGDHFPGDLGAGAEAVLVAERCLLDCWTARGPPPASGTPPPAWASRDVLPSVLGRLTGRALLVHHETPEELDAAAEPVH